MTKELLTFLPEDVDHEKLVADLNAERLAYLDGIRQEFAQDINKGMEE